MAGELIVSISGIKDRTLADVAAFRDELAERGVPASYLVAPRLKGGYRLDRDADTVEWLTARRADGDAVVLHGYDEAATKKRRGEFAALPAHEANLRLMGADRVLEHLGLRTRLFAAPGWTVSQGTLTALPRNGFRLVAELGGMTDLVRGTTVRARVVGIGEGSSQRPGGAAPWCCRPNAPRGGPEPSGSPWLPRSCAARDRGRRCSTRSTSLCSTTVRPRCTAGSHSPR